MTIQIARQWLWLFSLVQWIFQFASPGFFFVFSRTSRKSRLRVLVEVESDEGMDTVDEIFWFFNDFDLIFLISFKKKSSNFLNSSDKNCKSINSVHAIVVAIIPNEFLNSKLFSYENFLRHFAWIIHRNPYDWQCSTWPEAKEEKQTENYEVIIPSELAFETLFCYSFSLSLRHVSCYS